MTTALQSNAADPDQIAYAARKQREGEKAAAAAVRHQLSTYEGRATVWAAIERAQVFARVQPGLSLEGLYRWLGRRDEGLEWLIASMRHRELYLQMWTEALKRDAREHEERTAAVTPRAGDTKGQG